MIRILIIEDEIPSRKKLTRFIEEVGQETSISGEISTIAEAVEFFEKNQVDLVFSDIELLDGNAFEIYDRISLSCPIIFTTAYDQYMISAFESNGIAYLLKPFSKERFMKAWDKFMLLYKDPQQDSKLLSDLAKLIQQNFPLRSYKKRFTVHSSKGTYFLEADNIVVFEANEAIVFAFDATGKKHLLTGSTLKEIEEQLDPLDFFRINRSEIVNKVHIEKIDRDTKNTLAVKVKARDTYLRTSQSNTASFRKWIES